MRDDTLPSGAELRNTEHRKLRWYMLQMLDRSGSMGCNERLLFFGAERMGFEVLQAGIRSELEYLADKGLATITQGPVWIGKITAAGTDVVEHSVPCPPGIERPAQY